MTYMSAFYCMLNTPYRIVKRMFTFVGGDVLTHARCVRQVPVRHWKRYVAACSTPVIS